MGDVIKLDRGRKGTGKFYGETSFLTVMRSRTSCRNDLRWTTRSQNDIYRWSHEHAPVDLALNKQRTIVSD